MYKKIKDYLDQKLVKSRKRLEESVESWKTVKHEDGTEEILGDMRPVRAFLVGKQNRNDILEALKEANVDGQ